MYLKQIELDGFKSYSKKTVINDFDPQFNAITGLNGTGKSNILDAICFVLGLSNHAHLRVANIKELIYKNGQAGISKARVTLTFDNNGPNRPSMYVDHDTITVTREVNSNGRNRHFINGSSKTYKDICNLFEEVSLNVNNPHFLIMQGRITKVMNMKPEQVLEMIGEAAGTRMYETRRKQTLATLNKKEAKLREIDELMETRIQPHLNKLSSTRKELISLQQAEQTKSRTERTLVAFDYYQAGLGEEGMKGELEVIEGKSQMIEGQLQSASQSKAELEGQIKDLTSNMENSSIKKDYVKVQKELARLDQEIAVTNTKIEGHKEQIFELSSENERLCNNLPELQRSLEVNENMSSSVKNKLSAISQDLSHWSTEVNRLEANKKSMITGISSNGGMTLDEQLMEAKVKVGNYQNQLKKAQEKHTNMSKLLESQRKMISSKDQEKFEQIQNHIRSRDEEIKQMIDRSKQPITSSSDSFPNMEALNLKLDSLNRDLTAKKGNLSNLQSEYQKRANQVNSLLSVPQSNKIDQNAIKGPVIRLFNLKDQSYLTAIETASQKHFTSIVVDSDQTASTLLSSNLKHRTMFLPLNKVTGPQVTEEDRNYICQVTNGNAKFAIDVVNFPEWASNVMAHVFKKIVICEAQYARILTYDSPKKYLTITFDGDIYDPQGTLSGGSAGKKGSFLSRFLEVRDLEGQIRKTTGEIQTISEEVRRVSMLKDERETLLRLITSKTAELDRFKSGSKSDQSMQKIQKFNEISQNITHLSNQIEEFQCLYSQESSRLGQLSHSLSQADGGVSAELERLEKQIVSSSRKLSEIQASYSEVSIEVQRLESENRRLLAELEDVNDSIRSNHKRIALLEEEINQFINQISDYQQLHVAATEKFEALQRKIGSNEVDSLRTALNQLRSKISSLTDEKSTLHDQLRQLHEKLQNASATRISLAKQYEWLNNEDFDSDTCEFNFKNNPNINSEIQQSKAQYNESIKVIDSMKKQGINTVDVSTFDKTEKEFLELSQKRTQVKADADRIQSVISQLDEKKVAVINESWTKVNADFGKIFSRVLPGSQAKLVPHYAEDDLVGLSFAVGFGGHWKESLGELSGGQKSLLALSMILALLRFNSAPIYILDEIDSALDLSHTQNIGKLIKQEFKDSQFLIVSLKEGMFRNANVIFNTRFVDGTSHVFRSTGQE
ncbi:hypothetical protein P9112_003488 [Eukaryota sp. TZLM1-RC]